MNESKLVLAKIQSRHSNASTYRTYVKYRPCDHSINQSEEDQERLIEGWYCTCKNGARTDGCCSHIASINYYLSIGMHSGNLPNLSSRLDSFFPYTVVESSQAASVQESQPKRKNIQLDSSVMKMMMNRSMTQLISQEQIEIERPKRNRSKAKN